MRWKKGVGWMDTYNGSQSHRESINTRKSKVSYLHLTQVTDQNVLRFQITVSDAVGVKEVNSTQNLVHQVLYFER